LEILLFLDLWVKNGTVVQSIVIDELSYVSNNFFSLLAISDFSRKEIGSVSLPNIPATRHSAL